MPICLDTISQFTSSLHLSQWTIVRISRISVWPVMYHLLSHQYEWNLPTIQNCMRFKTCLFFSLILSFYSLFLDLMHHHRVRHLTSCATLAPYASWCIATFWPRIHADRASHAKEPEGHRAAQSAASHFLSEGVAEEQLFVVLIRKKNNVDKYINYSRSPACILWIIVSKLNLKIDLHASGVKDDTSPSDRLSHNQIILSSPRTKWPEWPNVCCTIA